MLHFPQDMHNIWSKSGQHVGIFVVQQTTAEQIHNKLNERKLAQTIRNTRTATVWSCEYTMTGTSYHYSRKVGKYVQYMYAQREPYGQYQQ